MYFLWKRLTKISHLKVNCWFLDQEYTFNHKPVKRLFSFTFRCSVTFLLYFTALCNFVKRNNRHDNTAVQHHQERVVSPLAVLIACFWTTLIHFGGNETCEAVKYRSSWALSFLFHLQPLMSIAGPPFLTHLLPSPLCTPTLNMAQSREPLGLLYRWSGWLFAAWPQYPVKAVQVGYLVCSLVHSLQTGQHRQLYSEVVTPNFACWSIKLHHINWLSPKYNVKPALTSLYCL